MMRQNKKRPWRWLVALAVVAALGGWVASRWSVWFGNPEEPAYAPAEEPARILLTFGEGDALSRNISWTCGGEVEPSYVDLCADNDTLHPQSIEAQGELFRSRSGEAAYYVARLSKDVLEAGRAYSYRVRTGEKRSAWHSFQTPQADSPSTTFLFMGDVQDTLGGVAGEMLRSAVARHPETSFFVSGGDLVERPIDAYWGEAFRSIDSVAQTMPVLTVTGNHDYLKAPIRQLERRFSLVHSYFLDSMEGENQVYSVRPAADVELFLLDSNREFPYLWTQRKWLEQRLRASEARWKIVVLHHPLYSIRGKMNNIIQRWMFDDIIRSHGVDLVLQGHEHAYARMEQRDAEGMSTTPVYTVSHCSPKNYRIQFDERFTRYGSGSRYYQKISAHADTLTLTAYDALSHALYDSLLIVKSGAEPHIVDPGRLLPEEITFTPAPGNKKDAAFAERIKAYKERRK